MRHSEQARTMYESELQTLQARVEPGLLFQTLSRVRDLYDVDAHAADAMLDELILYLRAAMPRMRDTAAPLAQELELARSWITIVDRHRALTATFECDASAGAARMPSMLLLPLVSALLAQRYHPQRAATLRVGAALARSRLCVTIVLDPAGEGELPRLALIDPLCERLAALFGTQASLVLSPVGGRIEALLEMPHEATDRPDR
jgi:LytS/YehU family sensor histidine kinase